MVRFYALMYTSKFLYAMRLQHLRVVKNLDAASIVSALKQIHFLSFFNESLLYQAEDVLRFTRSFPKMKTKCKAFDSEFN